MVIIDGGSNDGSTTPQQLTELHVHTLLLKEHSAGQGEQMRVGFYHALAQGYQYIISMDGNDKDNPESLPLFIAKLQEGYDFVQGSRFLEKGNSVNTPWHHSLAIKLLHAPLLSLETKFHWTDTTQNYRGYSRRLLCDPRAQILRDIFCGYELTPYIPHIVAKIGLKMTEISTQRVYPPSGLVPTKIHGFAGNLNVLKVLCKAVAGHYDP